MGLLDVVKGVGGGALDIVKGGAGFAVDTAKAAVQLGTGDLGGAASTWFESWQEDVLGSMVTGAFGPEGVIGSVIGALPEDGPFGFIRTGGRQIITPAMEGWDWVMQTVVDDGLGTFATVMHAGLRGGNPLAIFDGSTWAKAYEINSKSFDPVTGERIEGHGRTFGQSVAAALWINDPFDDEEYNSIKDDALFNIFSGSLDFAQEFLDPVDILLGGSANLLSGKTAVGRVTKTGGKISDVKVYGVKKVIDPVTGKETLRSVLGRRHLAPQRVYARGGGLGWRRLDQKAGEGIVSSRFFKELTPEQRAIRQAIGSTSTQARAASFVASNKWKMVEDALAKVDDRVAPMGDVEAAQGFMPRADGKSWIDPIEAARQRATILRETVGRRGAKMPEQAAFAIAHGRTAEARRLTARAVMGDMTAFREAGDIAAHLINNIEDGYLDSLGTVEAINGQIKGLDEKIAKEGSYEAASKGKKGYITRLNNQKTKLQDELHAARIKTIGLADEIGLDAVDFEMMFDFSIAAHASQVKRVTNNTVGPRVDDISEVMTDNAGMQAMSELALRNIADAENYDDLGKLGIGHRQMGNITEVRRWRNLDNVVRSRRQEMMSKGQDVAEDVYYIPSVINPFGMRRLRIFTERVPQTLIEFSDPLAFTQYERMLAQASKVKIRGKKITSKEAVEKHLGEWMEITQRRGSNFQNELRDLFSRTRDDLVKAADDIIKDEGIEIGGKTLQQELVDATNLKNTAVAGRVNRKGKRVDTTPDRQVQSVGAPEHTTVSYIGGDGVDYVNYNMSPQMVRQAEVIPRFDLINTQLRDFTRLDGQLHHRAWVKSKDTFKRVTKYPRKGAEVVQGIWRPAVLLTPKWPMRVQLDEVLRRMADLGTISEMRSLFGAMGDLKDGFAGRAIENGLTEVPSELRRLVETKKLASEGQLTDLSKEQQALLRKEVNDMSDAQILDALDPAEVKKVVLDSAKAARKASKVKRWMPAATRAFIGLQLINPLAGAAWAGMYGISQWRRTNRVAIRRSGIAHADLHMKEAKRLLKEALEEGDEVLVQHANFLLDQGANMNSILDEIHRYDIDVSEIRNSVEKADVLLAESGFDNLKIGGIAARGAFGDDSAFIEMLHRSVSSSKAQHAMYKGYRDSVERELRKYSNPDWQRWDALDGRSEEIFRKGFSETMQRYTAIGDRWQQKFFDHVWGPEPREQRISGLARALLDDEGLQQSTGAYWDIKKARDADVDVLELANEIATKMVDEYDGILPQGVADRARKTARDQGTVRWGDVTKELKENFEGKELKEIIVGIRNGTLEGVGQHRHFGMSVAPHPTSVNTQRGILSQQVDGFVDRIFENLGTLPADHLSRNPYYKTKYNRFMYQYLAPYMDEAGEVSISATQLRRVEDDARQAALRETRDLLYDLAEETRIGEITAMVMPFYNAWQEVIGRWAKLGQENPAFVAKAARLYMSDWNAEVLGITEIHDEESGASFLAFRLPEGLIAGAKKFTESTIPEPLRAGAVKTGIWKDGPLLQILEDNPIRFSKEGLASMLQSTTPGFGPLVSIPVREAVLADPSLEETFGFMFPFGHPEGGLLDRVKANLMPAYLQNVENRYVDTQTRERIVQAQALQIFVENAEAGTPIDIEDPVQLNALIEEANSRANNFFTFRVATGLLVPTSTSVFSPYDDLMKEARKLQKEHGTMKGNQLFLEEYGHEFFALTARMTRLNDGVSASATSEAAYMQHEELIGNHPEVGGWISGSLGAGDEEFKFNQAVYRRQTQMEISPADPRKRRERKTIYETIADTEVERGWAIYTVYKDGIREEQEKRQAAGLDYSLASTEMFPYKQVFDGLVDQLKDDIPSWGVEFDQKTRISKMPAIIEGFMAGIQEDSILQRPSTQHVLDYFELRGFVESELIKRSRTINPATGRVGSDNLGASSNADLMMLWESQRERIALRPEFSKIYDRYFELDFISRDSFISELDPDMWNHFMNGTGF